MNSKNLFIFVIITIGTVLILSEVIRAQQTSVKLPKIEAPKPATLGQAPVFGFGFPRMPSAYNPTRTKDPLAVWRADQQRMAQQRAYLEELNRELAKLGALYDFPSKLGHREGTQGYLEAFDELGAMLDGKQPLDLKRAVFLVENAYFNNKGNYQDFENQIDNFADLTKQFIAQQGWDIENPMTPLMALHKMFADTVMIEGKGTEDNLIHYPISYDFEDYRGREDLTKLFVSKLLATGSGQCYSLPQLYLILAEELGGQAWLTYAPQHSYVKFKDNNNNWHNLELTNGNLASESWLMASGYVNAETIQNGMYMDTLSLKETVASKLVDLAYGYGYKYGYDPLMMKMLDKALEAHPVNPSALMLTSNYYTAQVDYIHYRMGRNDQAFTQDLKAMEALNNRNEFYAFIDQMGYQQMPSEVYETWLKSVDTYKAKQSSEQQVLKIERTLKQN